MSTTWFISLSSAFESLFIEEILGFMLSLHLHYKVNYFFDFLKELVKLRHLRQK